MNETRQRLEDVPIFQSMEERARMAKAKCELSEKVPTGTTGIDTYHFRCTWDKHDRNTYSVQANGANLQQALALALERVPFEPDHPHHEH